MNSGNYPDTENYSIPLTAHILQAREVGSGRGKKVFHVERQPQPERARQGGQLRAKPATAQQRGQKLEAKQRSFSHEQLLQSYKGCSLAIVLTDGDEMDVKLLDADRYTLLVETRQARELIFKSAIAEIRLAPPSEG